jgi:hypothetical protein
MDASTQEYPANANQGYNQRLDAPAERDFSERSIPNVTNSSDALFLDA